MEIDGKKVASTGTTALSIVGTVLGSQSFGLAPLFLCNKGIFCYEYF